MKIQDIIDRLTVLGLDAAEAAVYVHLSMMGPSKASDIAAALKLHRTEAYRTLQNLVQRGFAAATLSRPAKFEAAPPEKLFEELLAAQQARHDSIARAQDDIATALTTLRGTPTEGFSKNTFKILQGRREIYNVLERMVRETQREMKGLSTHEGAVAMTDMAGIWDLCLRRAEEGLSVKIILRTTDQMRAKLATAPDVPTLAFRHLASERLMRYAIIDDRELLIWVVSDPSSRLSTDQDVALWSDATDLVGTQSAHFDAMWREARDVRPMMIADGLTPADRGVPRR